jgi:phosphatidylserine/phosphatidylglycerophosphate/cardiolipin synthase-like enzyme
MADRRIEGRVVFTGTGPSTGIEGLDVVAFDLDPFFSEDRLGSSPTDSDGKFKISYTPSRYSDWLPGRNPDIVIRVYAPGGRLLHETSEQSDVADVLLTINTIQIHPANVTGWLVTNATLDPANPRLDSTGTPVTWSAGNKVTVLNDGESMFPAITDAIEQANSSINCINMNFWLGKNLITRFPAVNDPNHPFDPRNPAIGQPVVGTRFHEALLARAKDTTKPLSSTNVLVQDVPFIDQIPVISFLLRRFLGVNPDSADEVKEFFRNSPVGVRLMSVLSASNFPTFMHAKALVVDGTKGFVLGSPLSRSYFGAEDHLINDARHGGSLIHDVSVKIEGPAVEHIDRCFTTLWNAADSSGAQLSPATGQGSQGGLGVQIVRTLPGGVFNASHTGGAGLPHGETGALEAYQRAIANATKFIYLEDQYFTAPEVFQALLHRMIKVPALEVVLVINAEPDVKGYPEKQIQNLKQFRADLVKAIGEEQAGKRLGIYTLWSCNEKEPKIEIRPIYVHAKVAVVDDIWATIGSANLDGASLNQIELDTIVQGALAALVEEGALWKRILAAVIMTVASPLVILTVGLTSLGFSRKSQHANPQQSRQPTRSTELNVVICEKAPNITQPNASVKAFRETLWKEHLGLASLPTPGTGGWVEVWNQRAQAKFDNIQQDATKAASQRQKHPAKVLKWVPQVFPGKYLQALGLKTTDLRVREKADSFNFETGQYGKKE